MAGYRSCTRSRPPGWGRVLLKSHRLERGNLKKQLGDRRALALGREVGWSSMSSPGMGVKKTLASFLDSYCEIHVCSTLPRDCP